MKSLAFPFLIFFVALIILLTTSEVSFHEEEKTTTTTFDCASLDPNYCDTHEDCICSMSKCFRGNKIYAENCVEEAEVCPENFCFFAPGEGMVCVNHTCQVGKLPR